jgi:hypothetical protein
MINVKRLTGEVARRSTAPIANPTHSSAVFEKTGVSRQGELVALLARMSANGRTDGCSIAREASAG